MQQLGRPYRDQYIYMGHGKNALGVQIMTIKGETINEEHERFEMYSWVCLTACTCLKIHISSYL